jgi:hypothetical protein
MSGVAEEFETIDLGDARRNRRAIRLLNDLGERPTASIPGACRGWAEIQAAYRFLGNQQYDWLDLLEPHRVCTQARMAGHPVVLCAQDTTELDFNGQAIEGLGPLSYEAQRGMYLHPTYALTPQREPLGVLDAWMWAREFKDAEGQRGGEPESRRWLEGYERVAELAAGLPATRLVYLADREADLLPLMIRARELEHPADWLIRAQHNRALPDGDGEKLWARVLATDPLGEVRFTLPPGRGRRSREVRQAIYAHRVSVSDRRGGRVEATCVTTREIDAPPGVKPIEWRLLTNRRAETLEAAVELVEWYRARWDIELLFLALKVGCRVEALQLSTLQRLERTLILYLIISWRIARLKHLGRTSPELDASGVFESEEWQAAYLLAKKPVPMHPPPLYEVVRLIARHGGFIGRKNDGEPGLKSLWIGLQRVRDVVIGMKHVRQRPAGEDSDTADAI